MPRLYTAQEDRALARILDAEDGFVPYTAVADIRERDGFKRLEKRGVCRWVRGANYGWQLVTPDSVLS